MNQSKTEELSIVGDNIIQLNGSDGKTSIIFSKGIDMTVNRGIETFLELYEIDLN